MELKEGQRVLCRGTDCIHYEHEGTVAEVLVSDREYGLALVEWDDGKKSVARECDLCKTYYNGYVYTIISEIDNFPEECVFRVKNGRLFGKNGKAGLYRFESFIELAKRLAKSGTLVTEVKGLYDEHTGKAKRGEDGDAGREDY